MSKVELLKEFGLSDVYPKLTQEKIQKILKILKTEPSAKADVQNVDELPEDIQMNLKRIFITKTDKSSAALKARFINYLELINDFSDYEISAENVEIGGAKVDYIMKNNDEDTVVWIMFSDYFDSIYYKRIDRALNSYFEERKSKKDKKDEDLLPESINIVSSKIERKTALKQDSFRVLGSMIPISHYMELVDMNRPFNDEDKIVVNRQQVKGFNFGNMEDVLLYTQNAVKSGKCEIFLDTASGERKILWKGIVNPKKFFKQGGK